jgi:hypothetical protein
VAIIYTNSFRFGTPTYDTTLAVTGSGTAPVRVAGRFPGGYAFGQPLGSAASRTLQVNFAGSLTPFSFGFAHYAGTGTRTFNIGTGTANDTISVPNGLATTCVAYTNTTAWTINSSTPIPNGWQWFCIQMIPNVTTGGLGRFYWNGNLIATKGADTSGTSPYQGGVSFSLGGSTTDSLLLQAVGDVVISDDPNYLIPDSRVDMLLPNADVGTVWTPSTGTTLFPLVADSGGPTVNADYISSGTVGAHQQFDLENLPHNPSTVRAVTTIASTMKSDTGPRTMTVTLNGVDGTAIDSGVQDWRRRVYETNPSGGATWSAADVNAARVGVKVVT